MRKNIPAIDTIVAQIVSAIDTKIANLQFDRTFPSVVQSAKKDGTYEIAYEGRLRKVYSALPGSLSVGQWVWVKIPQGQLRNMHICGIRQK